MVQDSCVLLSAPEGFGISRESQCLGSMQSWDVSTTDPSALFCPRLSHLFTSGLISNLSGKAGNDATRFSPQAFPAHRYEGVRAKEQSSLCLWQTGKQGFLNGLSNCVKNRACSPNVTVVVFSHRSQHSPP